MCMCLIPVASGKFPPNWAHTPRQPSAAKTAVNIPQHRRLVRQRAVEDDVDLDLPPEDPEEPEAPEAPEEPEGPEEPEEPEEPEDIADRIEHLLFNIENGADGCVASCIALYRHKRSHRDDDTTWLEEAVRAAKKSRNC